MSMRFELDDQDLQRLAELVASKLAPDGTANGAPVPRCAAAVLTVPALLSVEHAAELLDCSPRTVRRRIAADELAAVVENGRTMVRGDDLRDYIDRLERLGAPARRRPRTRRSPYPRL